MYETSLERGARGVLGVAYSPTENAPVDRGGLVQNSEKVDDMYTPNTSSLRSCALVDSTDLRSKTSFEASLQSEHVVEKRFRVLTVDNMVN